MSEEVGTLGKALPLLNYCTKDSQKLMIYMQFSYSVTPPPQVSGSAPDNTLDVSTNGTQALYEPSGP